MQQSLFIVFLTAAAGACIPLGGFVASFEHIKPNWLEQELRYFIIAFGGGIMLGAVSMVLVPEGQESMGQVSILAVPILLAGGFCFFGIERMMGLKRHESPQLMGMILDYIPEAIALGGLAALGSPVVPLLALLIGLQNLPEGFNAYKEMMGINHNARKTLTTMLLLVVLGPVAGLSGYLFLADYPMLLGSIMLFASGGILYLIFQDIAPQSRLDKHWAPPLGAVFGFCLALLSQMLH